MSVDGAVGMGLEKRYVSIFPILANKLSLYNFLPIQIVEAAAVSIQTTVGALQTENGQNIESEGN